MARTNAQSNALKPKTDRMAERIASQKQRLEKPTDPKTEPSAAPIPTGEGPQATPEPERNRGGRPRNETEKTRLVVYLDKDTAKAVKLYALEHESTYSDVANAVLTRYLAELDPAELKK